MANEESMSYVHLVLQALKFILVQKLCRASSTMQKRWAEEKQMESLFNSCESEPKESVAKITGKKCAAWFPVAEVQLKLSK